MAYGLLGEKLSGTVLQKIYDKIGKDKYKMWERTPEEVDSFMREAVFLGAFVDKAYREKVFSYVENFSREAELAGSANTVIYRDGHLTGYHTEYAALVSVMRKMKMSLEGKKVLIFGDGETGRIARLLATDQGASHIYQIPENEAGKMDDSAYGECADAEILIQTGSCGTAPDLEDCPVDLGRLPKLTAVVETIWDPLRTALVLEAEKRGIPARGGLYFLVAQAIHAVECFLNTTFGDEMINDIYHQILNERRNLVLVGMSQVGKTTVGTMLSQRLNRRLEDTDHLIIAKEGCEITEIFAKGGEPYFRDVESEVVRQVALEHELIIATGGGAVLREKNVEALKKNGLIIFLDRPLDQLTPTDDRPLANSAEKIYGLFRTRYPIYKSVCDRHVINHLSPNIVTGKILRVMENKKKLLVLNGPSLHMLGVRDPDVYGYTSYNRLYHNIKIHAMELGVEVECYQSNHEGDLVDKILNAYGVMDGIVINPGAYAYTSLAMLDALRIAAVPTVEVHLFEEEKDEFRRNSYIRSACKAAIIGHGPEGYLEAMDLLAKGDQE